MRKYIDTKLNFNDFQSVAKVTNKTPRQIFIEQQDALERSVGLSSTLIKDHARQTAFFKDSAAYQFPIDAFQVIDFTINLPLNKYWAQELVPIRYGGGAAESIAAFRNNIALAEGRLAGGNTNEVPLVGITDEKIVSPVYAIKLGILLGTLDLMKAETINYDILERHENALRTSYWREIELFGFEGNLGIGNITSGSSTGFKGGLLNQPITGDGAVGYSILTDAQWSTYTVNDFVEMVVGAAAKMKQSLRFNRDYFPNKCLIPPTLWTHLQKAAVVGALGAADGTGIAMSNFEYVRRELKNRLGVDVEFVELPYLDAGAETTQGFPIEVSGVGLTGRVILYRHDEKVFKMPITMALTGGAALPSPTEDGIRKNYVAFAGPPLVIYPEAIYYIDNKAA
jgi:hypothetical protein